MKRLLTKIRRCLNHVFLLEQLKNYLVGDSLTQKLWRGPTTWKDMLENPLSDAANWRTRKWSTFTKFQVLAWMIVNSSRRSLKQLENCHKYAPTLSRNALYLARTGRSDILWSVNKLARAVTKWTRACGKPSASRSAKGEWVEKAYDYVMACSSPKGRISDMQVIEDFESRPHKAVTFVVQRGKARQEWNEHKLPKVVTWIQRRKFTRKKHGRER